MSLLPVEVMTMSASPMRLLDGDDVEAVHQRLQRVDRVDLGDGHPRALAGQRLRAALADVAVAADQHLLAADQHVGAAVDAVDQRVPGAVLVVELGLGHRVVDVDGRERQLTGRGELVEPQHAGGGLLGDTLDRLGDLRPLDLSALSPSKPRADQRQEDLPFGGIVVLGGRDHAGLLVLRAAQHQHGGVTAVVEDHVRRLVRPGQHLLGGPPVLLERLALPGEHRDALGLLRGAVRSDDDGRGGVVLGGEDVAARPSNLGAEGRQGLDQHGGLHGHVQRARDAGALERLDVGVLAAQCHQAGHLVLGQPDLLAAELGQRQVGDLVVDAVAHIGGQCRCSHVEPLVACRHCV